MVMQYKGETGVVCAFDYWLVVTKGLVAGQSNSARGNRFKKSEFVPSGLTKKHQKHDDVVSDKNFEDVSYFQNVIAEHLCYHNKSNFVLGSSNHYVFTELVARLEHGRVLQNVTR